MSDMSYNSEEIEIHEDSKSRVNVAIEKADLSTTIDELTKRNLHLRLIKIMWRRALNFLVGHSKHWR